MILILGNLAWVWSRTHEKSCCSIRSVLYWYICGKACSY